MRRTQIYLDPDQTRAIDRLARNAGTNRSTMIREAVERYIAAPDEPDARRARYLAAIDELEARPLRLPSGFDYVEALRGLDLERDTLHDRRRHTGE